MSSVKQVAKVLRLFVEEPSMGVAEMSRRLQMSRSWTYELAGEMADVDLLQKDERTGRYHLGFALMELGNIARARNELAEASRPILTGLAQVTKETTNVGVLTGSDVMIIDTVSAYPAQRLFSRLGSRIPSYATSVGKAILAYERPETVERVIAAGLEPLTPKTITDPDEFRRELELIRQRGHALNVEEIDRSVYCIGVPVFDSARHVIAGISIGGPSNRMNHDRLKGFVDLLKTASAEISRLLDNGQLVEHSGRRA